MIDSPSRTAPSDSIQALAAALREGRLTINALDDGSGVLLDLEREQLMTLNAPGMAIVEAVDAGAASRDDLLAALVRRFEVDPDTASGDLGSFLRALDDALSG